jgi:hypothetical protein
MLMPMFPFARLFHTLDWDTDTDSTCDRGILGTVTVNGSILLLHATLGHLVPWWQLHWGLCWLAHDWTFRPDLLVVNLLLHLNLLLWLLLLLVISNLLLL